MTGGRGADIIIEASGSGEALLGCIPAVRGGGTISALGFYEKNLSDFPIDTLVLNQIVLKGGAGWYGNASRVAEIMVKNKTSLLPIITQRMKFDECLAFFENADKYKKEKIKVIIEFD